MQELNDINLESKYAELKKIISSYGSVIVAFSGGVDSTLVARATYDVLAERTIAVTIRSESLSRTACSRAMKLSSEIGIRHIIVKIDKLSKKEYRINNFDRCYHCKSMDAHILKKVADQHGIDTIIDGVNTDDMKDYRPGLRAFDMYNVKHPLYQLGFNKILIRKLAKSVGLSNADLPADSCLSSRITYLETIDEEKLNRIEKSEDFIKSLGFSNVRVRDVTGSARIELPEAEISGLFEKEMCKTISNHLKSLGFRYVTVDLEGLKHGSMNRIIDAKKKTFQTSSQAPSFSSSHDHQP